MMNKLFAVYDSKSLLHQPAFQAPAAGVAIRAFETAACTEGNDFNKYAADFTLFELGEIDTSTGIITPHPAPVNLGNARHYSDQDAEDYAVPGRDPYPRAAQLAAATTSKD